MSKRILATILVLSVLFAFPCHAAAATSEEPSPEDPISPRVVYGTYYMSPDLCQSVYEDYVTFTGDYSDIASALADTLAASGYYSASAATTLASALGSIYYYNVIDACNIGRKGNGCKVIVYTDATPYITAL